VTAETRSATREAIPSAAWKALAIGAAGFVLVGFNSTATNIAFGDIADSFPDVPETTVQFVSSGYFIGTAAFLPLAGRIADRRGRALVFNIGIAVFAVSAVLSAIAPTIWVLIGARAVQSLGGALIIPASLSMVLPLFPASRRSTAVAAWAASGPLSAAVAPSLSAAVLEVSSWRWLYFLSAPVALIILAFGVSRLEEVTPPAGEGRLDMLGAALGTAGIALLVFAVGKGGDWGWWSVSIVGCFAAAAAFTAAFVVQSLRHPQPMIDFSLFRAQQVWMANAANSFISVCSLSIWLVWPLYLGRVWGYSSLQIGLGLTAGPVAAGTMTLVGGRLAERTGHRVPNQLGSLVMVAAVGWCWFVLDADGRYLTSFLPGIVMFGFGWGLSSPTMNSFALDAVPEAAWGTMNAAFNMFRNVAGAVGVAAAVAFVGSADRVDIVAAFDRAWLFLFVMTLLGATMTIVFYPRRKV
jgi:EmrB/QacA subfamily drug resistance transporter